MEPSSILKFFRSLQYGFVEFSQHEHALAALRALDNKPNGLGPKTHRLIVMFAVDDMRKLALRNTRLAKSRQKLEVKRLQKELQLSNASPARVGIKINRDVDAQSLSARPVGNRTRKELNYFECSVEGQ